MQKAQTNDGRMLVTSDLYSSYAAMKGWSSEASFLDPSTFQAVLSASGAKGRLKILEIGFGDGSFMDWARSEGHEIAGTEIIADCVAAAKARGHRAYLAPDIEVEAGEFDVIVALDVLEHLDRAGFEEFTGLAAKVLKPEGVIVARFPNGDSPFFGRYQHGDFTHAKPLSARSLGQLLMPLGFEVSEAMNLRPLPPSFLRRMKRRLTYAARDLVETILGYVYFGFRIPMDPNITVVVRRSRF